MESGSAADLNIVGSGNVVGSIGKSGKILTANMSTMVDIVSTQNITGPKTFKSWLTVNANAFHGLVLRRDLGGSGSSILFANSDGNLGKVGFTGDKNLVISRGNTIDGTPDLLHINATTQQVTTYGNLNVGIVTSANIMLASKTALRGSIDTWLRINDQNAFTSGIYTGTSTIRTDGAIHVGSGGNYFLVTSDGGVKAAKNITSAGFVKTGSNDNYMLLGGGGHKTIASLGIQNKLNSFYGQEVHYYNGIGGASDDQKWYKVLSYSYTGTSSYQALKIYGTIKRSLGNWGYAEIYEIPFQVTLNAMNDTSALYMPIFSNGASSDCIRVVKTGSKSWELHFRKPTAHQRIEVEFTVFNASAGGYQIFKPQVLADTLPTGATIVHTNTLTVSRPVSDRIYKADTLTTARTFWGQSFNGTANVSGNMTGVGSISASGGIITTAANGFRINRSKFGVIFHHNDTGFYLLTTNENDPAGNYNSLRPFSFNLSTGLTSVGNGLTVNGNATFNNSIAAKSTLSVTGTTTLSSTLTVSGQTTINNNLILNKVNGRYIQLGGVRLVYDSANEAIRIESSDSSKKAGLYTTGFLTARGLGTSNSEGGQIKNVYTSKYLGNQFDDTATNDTFNAFTINNIYNRVISLEAGSALRVDITGQGNAVTSIEKNGTVITVKKENTFVDLVSGQVITGAKTFSNALTVNSNYYNALVLKRSTANGSSILFSNSAGNLGKLGFDSGKNLIIGRGTTADGTADLLHINGTSQQVTTYGQLSVSPNTASNAKLLIANKLVINGSDGWLRINDTNAFTSGIYLGTSSIRTDGSIHVGSAGDKFFVNASGTVRSVSTVSGSQLISTIATGTAPFKVTSTTAVTNLNADLLDGFHATTFLKADYTNGYYGFMTPGGSNADYIRTTVLGLLPFQQGNAGSGHGNIGTTSWYFKNAYIDNVYGSLSGNASSATKLLTPRTIWGRNFDGTSNISGDMTGVGTINASGWLVSTGQVGWRSATYGGGIYMNDATYLRVYGNKKLYITNSASDSIFTTGGVKLDQIISRYDSLWGIVRFHSDYSSNNGFRNGLDIQSNGDIQFYAASKGYTNPKSCIMWLGNGQLRVGGNMFAEGAVTALVTGTSDLRLKEDIRSFNGLGLMHNIGKAFAHKWNNKALSLNKHFSNEYYNHSWSAQKVKEVLPQYSINNLYGKYLGINREGLLPILWNGVLELESKVDKELRELKEKYRDLEKKYKELKEYVQQ